MKRVAAFLKPVLVIGSHRSVGMGVIVCPFWVDVVQKAPPSHILIIVLVFLHQVFLVVWVFFHHDDLVVFRVRAAVHASQIDGVVDVCPEVSPLFEIFKIGEVSTTVGVRKRDWYAVGVDDEYVMWRRRRWRRRGWRGRRWR